MIINLGTAYRLTSKFTEAEQAFTRARKYTQMPALYIEEARNFLAQNKYEQARANARILQKNNIQIPDDIRAALNM